MRHTVIKVSASAIRAMLAGALIAIISMIGSPLSATPLVGRQHDQGSVLEVPSMGPQQHNDDDTNEIPNPGPVVQIPQRFLGCWTGAVSESDLTRLRMLTMPIIGAWLTKQYRVCFEREPAGLKATLADSNVERHKAVLVAKSQMTPVSASEDAVTLNGSLRMLERNSTGLLDPSLTVTSIVDEQVRLEGNLDRSGVMRVRGFVKGYYNGHAWFVASWTSDFQHQSSP